MEITRQEVNKNRRVALAVTLFAFTVLLLFLIYKNIISSDAAFTNTAQNEITIGLTTGNSEAQNAGKQSSATVSAKQQNSAAKLATDPNSEIATTQSNTQKLIDQYRSKTSNNTNQTNSPSESIVPGIKEEGTSKEGKPEGDGKFGFEMKGRTILAYPKYGNDTKEEGKVVVEIVVDRTGNVIEANPNGRGTTTGSAVLKTKAKQMAMATKFSADARQEEQHGNITIVFSFN